MLNKNGIMLVSAFCCFWLFAENDIQTIHVEMHNIHSTYALWCILLIWMGKLVQKYFKTSNSNQRYFSDFLCFVWINILNVYWLLRPLHPNNQIVEQIQLLNYVSLNFLIIYLSQICTHYRRKCLSVLVCRIIITVQKEK